MNAFNPSEPGYSGPFNTEMEQQLIGAVLTDNQRFHSVSGTVKPEHFYEPVHGEIWRLLSARISKDHVADAVTLGNDMATHEGLGQLGGPAYLARLYAASISGFAVMDYAEEVVKMATARALQASLNEATDKIGRGVPLEEIKSGLDIQLLELEETGQPTSIPLSKAFTNAIERINDAYQGEAPLGIQTGLSKLDKRLSGLFPSDLIILGGRPSMGKTALATSLAVRAAKDGQAVAIVSLEMNDEGLAHRIMSELSGVPYRDFRRAHEMSEADFTKAVDASVDNGHLPIEIVPPNVRDPGAILSALRKIDRKYAASGGLGLVLVDYLQLVTERGNSANERIGKVSNALKRIATILNVPVVALSQLSRGVDQRDNKRPLLSDLRDSGQIEQDADVVLYCYRDHYYLSRETPPKDAGELADYHAALAASKNVMEVITAKQRMGDIGADKIGCAIATNRFWNLEAQMDAEF